MKEYQAVQKEEKIPKKVICNKCGELIWEDKKDDSSWFVPSYFEGRTEWGYSSPWDLTTHDFQLCVTCYKGIIESFKIPVEEVPYFHV